MNEEGWAILRVSCSLEHRQQDHSQWRSPSAWNKHSQLTDCELYRRQDNGTWVENKRKNFRIFRNIRSDVASIKQKQDKRCVCHNSSATCLHQPPTSVNTTIIHPISQSQKVESDPLFFSSPYASSSKLRVDSDLSFPTAIVFSRLLLCLPWIVSIALLLSLLTIGRRLFN